MQTGRDVFQRYAVYCPALALYYLPERKQYSSVSGVAPPNFHFPGSKAAVLLYLLPFILNLATPLVLP